MRYSDYVQDMDEAYEREDRLTAKILKLQRENTAQAAEIARLRAALGEIAGLPERYLRTYGADIAKAALEPKP